MFKYLQKSLLILGGFICALATTYGHGIQAPKIDPQEGPKRIAAFRNYQLPGDYSFHFTLTHKSKQGKKSHYYGTLWGTYTENGPLTRYQIGKDFQLLVQSGPNPRIFTQTGQNPPVELPKEQWHQPLLGHLTFTPFDLSTLYLYWPDPLYEGPTEVIGSTAYKFLLFPPEPTSALDAIRVYLDSKFNILLKTETLDPQGYRLKTLHLRNFKKVQGQYLMKIIDLKDNISRAKTRFTVNAAALRLKLPQSQFNLAQAPQLVPDHQYTQL